MKKFETVGQRAAYAIRGRCVQNRTSLEHELRNADISSRLFWSWEKQGFSPTAYSLRKLAVAGYDVMWILMGGERDGE